MSDRAFVDTNVLLYLVSSNERKAHRAEQILEGSPLISVQVLNEIANVARRKMRLTWEETHRLLSLIKSICPQTPLTVEIHEKGLAISERHNLSVYDSMILASAQLALCSVVYSEDMQDGMVIDKTLRIVDPFRTEP